MIVVTTPATSTATAAGVVGALAGVIWLAAITLGGSAGWVRLRDRLRPVSRNRWAGWAASTLTAALIITSAVLLTGAAG